ncbi:MAG: hypothetical protein Q8Q62_03255, partial [Mesorhizobium sp.]|nr:hypothetical protein [Mesorhizobium sp.]
MRRQTQDRVYTELKHAAAHVYLIAAGRHVARALKYNPNWPLQPRLPAGTPGGGRWYPSVGANALIQLLQRLGPPAIARLRETLQRVRPHLTRIPKRWFEGEPLPKDEDFDKETQRIGPPSWHRFGHPNVRFRSERELREYLGPAGNGREWHHIVEKRLAANGRFPNEL